MRKEVIGAGLVLLMLLAAGGYLMLNNDGNDPNSPGDGDGTGDNNNQIGNEWDVYYVQSGDDLPLCNSDTNGRLYYVEADAGFQTCTSIGWTFVDLTGPAGADGSDGADGVNGTEGQDGMDGNDGIGGLTALAITTPEPSGANCVNGGVKIDVGLDDDESGSLEASEIDYSTFVCDGASGQDGVDGEDGTTGQDGTNGTDGTNGSGSPNTMLTSISSPAASLECDAGGRVMMQGLDNGDGGGTTQNGILESGEVDYTTTYCSKYVVRMVDDIYGGTYSSNLGSYMEILVGDTLYFSAYDGSSNVELWAHDTSTSSTWQVVDIYSGAGGSNPGYSMAILVGDTLYFSAIGGSSGNELWAHDTSNSSTWQVADI
ncbi:MAG TPA: hypothetical protein EYO22_07100, partial [Candidatus Poseidoniales archaeon]|nr:hypothetical protein [Candidatus Poseidoniales archaeon]